MTAFNNFICPNVSQPVNILKLDTIPTIVPINHCSESIVREC